MPDKRNPNARPSARQRIPTRARIVERYAAKPCAWSRDVPRLDPCACVPCMSRRVLATIDRELKVTATNRGTQRSANDFYPTPAWCVDRLLDAIGSDLPSDGACWLEPCAGDGAIATAVDRWFDLRSTLDAGMDWLTADLHERPEREPSKGISWILSDIEPRADGIERDDYLWMRPSRARIGIDVAITNPPYSLAWEFVEAMRGEASIVLALMRLNFAASERRAAWFRETQPSIFVLPNRPSFGKYGKTDAPEYAWFAWGLEDRGRVRWLDSTSSHERRRKP